MRLYNFFQNLKYLVFGWFEDSFAGNEQEPAHVLQVGYVKGREAAARNLAFNISDIPGTASIYVNLCIAS